MRLALLLLALTTPAIAEPRWCNVTDFGKTLVYPPIARAAHVTGLVSLRVTYERTGNVITVETINGPIMLVNAATEQIKQSTIGTDAPGSDPCESLFIINYELDDGKLPPLTPTPNVPGMFRGTVRAYVLVLSDPAFTITRKRHWYSFNPSPPAAK